MTKKFGELWRGDIPLARTFWLYWIVIGVVIPTMIVGIYTTEAMLTGASVSLSAAALWYAGITLIYNLFMTVCVWRSSERYEGSRHWKYLARLGVFVPIIDIFTGSHIMYITGYIINFPIGFVYGYIRARFL